MQTFDTPAQTHLATLGLNHLRHVLPELSGTVLWVQKLLDKRSFRVFLVDVSCLVAVKSKKLFHEVLHRREQRQSLDALGAPCSRYPIARDPPHLFRIALEESQIQFTPEAVDEKVF